MQEQQEQPTVETPVKDRAQSRNVLFSLERPRSERDKKLKGWKKAEKPSHLWSVPQLKQTSLCVISAIKVGNKNIYTFPHFSWHE